MNYRSQYTVSFAPPPTSPFSLTKILQRYSKKFAKKIDRTFLPFSIQPSSDGTDSGWNDYFKFVSISFCRELKFSRRYKITLWMNSAAELLWSSFIQLDARETKKNRFLFLWNFLPSGNLLERLGNISEDGQLVDSCRKKKATSFSLFLFLSLRINRRSLHDKSTWGISPLLLLKKKREYNYANAFYQLNFSKEKFQKETLRKI